MVTITEWILYGLLAIILLFLWLPKIRAGPKIGNISRGLFGVGGSDKTFRDLATTAIVFFIITATFYALISFNIL